MKKILHIAVLVFGFAVVIWMIIWITRSCDHKTVESRSWIIDSLKFYMDRSGSFSDSAIQSETKHEKDYQHYINPIDSVGRGKLGADIYNNAVRKAEADSLRKRTP